MGVRFVLSAAIVVNLGLGLIGGDLAWAQTQNPAQNREGTTEPPASPTGRPSDQLQIQPASLEQINVTDGARSQPYDFKLEIRREAACRDNERFNRDGLTCQLFLN